LLWPLSWLSVAKWGRNSLRRSPRMSPYPRRQPSARVVCRRRGPTGVNGGALRPSGSFAPHGRS